MKPKIDDAFVGAFRVTVLTCAGLAWAASIVAMVMIKARVEPLPGEEV